MPFFGKKNKKPNMDVKTGEKQMPSNYGAQFSTPGQPSHQQPSGSPPPAYPQQGQYPTQPTPQHQQQPPPAYAPVQQTFVPQDAAFDAGARFGTGSKPVIPPPPPGVMPNSAQVFSNQGHNVVVGQREQTFMGGTGDAGAVIW